MKTPHEILLERHRAAETKLDALRENVVAERFAVAGEKRRESRTVFSPVLVVMKLWQELVWPCRRIWAGMVAVWVVIVVFSFAAKDRETMVAENAPPPTPDVVMALKEQRQMMAQLLDAGPTDAVIRRYVPGPRSEERQIMMVG